MDRKISKKNQYKIINNEKKSKRISLENTIKNLMKKIYSSEKLSSVEDYHYIPPSTVKLSSEEQKEYDKLKIDINTINYKLQHRKELTSREKRIRTYYNRYKEEYQEIKITPTKRQLMIIKEYFNDRIDQTVTFKRNSLQKNHVIGKLLKVTDEGIEIKYNNEIRFYPYDVININGIIL